DVLSRELDVDTAGVRTEGVVHLEEALDLVDDPIEVPGLVAVRGGVRVAVHGVAPPDDLVPVLLDRAHDRGQRLAHLVVAPPWLLPEASTPTVRVVLPDVLQGELRSAARADLEADRVLYE